MNKTNKTAFGVSPANAAKTSGGTRDPGIAGGLTPKADPVWIALQLLLLKSKRLLDDAKRGK